MTGAGYENRGSKKATIVVLAVLLRKKRVWGAVAVLLLFLLIGGAAPVKYYKALPLAGGFSLGNRPMGDENASMFSHIFGTDRRSDTHIASLYKTAGGADWQEGELAAISSHNLVGKGDVEGEIKVITPDSDLNAGGAGAVKTSASSSLSAVPVSLDSNGQAADGGIYGEAGNLSVSNSARSAEFGGSFDYVSRGYSGADGGVALKFSGASAEFKSGKYSGSSYGANGTLADSLVLRGVGVGDIDEIQWNAPELSGFYRQVVGLPGDSSFVRLVEAYATGILATQTTNNVLASAYAGLVFDGSDISANIQTGDPIKVSDLTFNNERMGDILDKEKQCDEARSANVGQLTEKMSQLSALSEQLNTEKAPLCCSSSVGAWNANVEKAGGLCADINTLNGNIALGCDLDFTPISCLDWESLKIDPCPVGIGCIKIFHGEPDREMPVFNS